MRTRVLALVALALLLLGGGALASHPMFFPLSEHTIAKDITDSGMPLYRTTTFTTDDEQAVSWLLIWRDAKPHTVEWRWYWPEGRTYARSFSTIPPIDGFTGMWAAPVWSCLKIKGTDVAHLPGNWRVDVIVDYRKVLTEYFTINNPYAC
jgi:hypothetical protein